MNQSGEVATQKALRRAYRFIFPKQLLSERCDWISERFLDARLEFDPCPHIVLHDVLPAELYASIERDIPPARDWRAAVAMHRVNRRLREGRFKETGYPQMALDIGNPWRTHLALRRAAMIWNRRYLPYVQVITALVKQTMAPALTDYERFLIDRGLFADAQQQRSVFQEFCLRSEGWAIRPHVHDLQQAIQWMLYFPLPGSTEDQGTAFYRPTKPRTIPAADLSKTIWFEAEEEVEYCFTAPYRANTLVAFLNTPTSVHGNIAIPGMVDRRYIFFGSLWKQKPASVDVDISPMPRRAPAPQTVVA